MIHTTDPKALYLYGLGQAIANLCVTEKGDSNYSFDSSAQNSECKSRIAIIYGMALEVLKERN